MPKEESPIPDPFPLVCEKTRCIFCIGDKRKSYDQRMRTFSKPDKIMDHVESHLNKEPAGILACCHPACKAEGLVLNNILHFKNHVQLVHGIGLREPKYSKVYTSSKSLRCNQIQTMPQGLDSKSATTTPILI
jgi:hypothetical protein